MYILTFSAQREYINITLITLVSHLALIIHVSHLASNIITLTKLSLINFAVLFLGC